MGMPRKSLLARSVDSWTIITNFKYPRNRIAIRYGNVLLSFKLYVSYS